VLGEGAAAGGLALDQIAHVGHDRDGLAPDGADLLRGRGEAVGIASGEDDIGSGLGEG
jgi:hypothetical protein